jgi:hypothetical protein
MFYNVEMGVNQKPHQHIIISFKNIIGYNKEFIYNIKNYLVLELDENDIRVEQLSSFIEYKNRFTYIQKEENELNLIYI